MISAKAAAAINNRPLAASSWEETGKVLRRAKGCSPIQIQ